MDIGVEDPEGRVELQNDPVPVITDNGCVLDIKGSVIEADYPIAFVILDRIVVIGNPKIALTLKKHPASKYSDSIGIVALDGVISDKPCR